MTSQSPRIYLYKITFEEVPYYYYGVHKEKRYNEYYMGSPVTNKWYWELYTPKKQILQLFDFTDEGYIEAQEVERRLIKPFYNTDKWCLNEHCGGYISLDILRKVGKQNKELKRGYFSLSPQKQKINQRINGRKAVSRNKEKGNLFWNIEWQREQGLKGGTKGGSANTQNQFLARQKVGKTYGKQVGLSRQKSDLVEILKNSTTWKHKTGKTVTLSPQESVSKLCEELQDIEYFDTPNKALIGQLLRGKKKQLYGWSFTGMAISSQDTDDTSV